MSLRDNMRSLTSSPVDNSRPMRYEVAMGIGDNSNVAEEPFACGRVGTANLRDVEKVAIDSCGTHGSQPCKEFQRSVVKKFVNTRGEYDINAEIVEYRFQMRFLTKLKVTPMMDNIQMYSIAPTTDTPRCWPIYGSTIPRIDVVRGAKRKGVEEENLPAHVTAQNTVVRHEHASHERLECILFLLVSFTFAVQFWREAFIRRKALTSMSFPERAYSKWERNPLTDARPNGFAAAKAYTIYKDVNDDLSMVITLVTLVNFEVCGLTRHGTPLDKVQHWRTNGKPLRRLVSLEALVRYVVSGRLVKNLRLNPNRWRLGENTHHTNQMQTYFTENMPKFSWEVR
ncbi:hypothetical protein C8R48DRAFT_758060 [Suillus tomentosus]|nr:hypothetical protein C8R48DRAFT_758060 [Suillus tomentosus]